MSLFYPLAESFSTSGVLTFRRTGAAWYRQKNDYGGEAWRPEAQTDVSRVHRPLGTDAIVGTLIEKPTTNLVLRSSEIDNASWSDVGTPGVTANSTTFRDPFGTTISEEYEDNDAGVAEGRTQTYTGVVSTFYVHSCFLRCSTSASGLIVYHGGTNRLQSAANATGKWVRVSTTAAQAETTTPRFELYPAATGLTAGAVTPVANTGKCLFWETQAEASLWATTIVPTTSATASRDGERIEITVASTPWSPLQGGIAFDWYPIWDETQEAGQVILFSIDANHYFGFDGAVDKFFVRTNGVDTAAGAAETWTPNSTRYSFRFGWMREGTTPQIQLWWRKDGAAYGAPIKATMGSLTLPSLCRLGSNSAAVAQASGIYRDVVITPGLTI